MQTAAPEIADAVRQAVYGRANRVSLCSQFLRIPFIDACSKSSRGPRHSTNRTLGGALAWSAPGRTSPVAVAIEFHANCLPNHLRHGVRIMILVADYTFEFVGVRH